MLVMTVASVLVLQALVLVVPTASAHTCAEYSGCDANACKDGEEHDHTDYNYVERDEHCSSHAKQIGDCQAAGVTLPQVVCNIVAGNVTRVPDTGKVTSLPSNLPGCHPKTKPTGPVATFSAVRDPDVGCQAERTGMFAPAYPCAFPGYRCSGLVPRAAASFVPSAASIRASEPRMDRFAA